MLQMPAILHINDQAGAIEAAAFFAEHIDASYISHGDMMDDRAIDTDTWYADVADIFAIDARDAAANAANPLDDGLHLAIAYLDVTLTGIMLYELVTSRRSRYALLHDIVVAKTFRGQGIGSEMINWLEGQVSQAGSVGKLFLESGKHNETAHLFFEHRGYNQCSITMLKEFD